MEGKQGSFGCKKRVGSDAQGPGELWNVGNGRNRRRICGKNCGGIAAGALAVRNAVPARYYREPEGAETDWARIEPNRNNEFGKNSLDCRSRNPCDGPRGSANLGAIISRRGPQEFLTEGHRRLELIWHEVRKVA